MSEKENICLEIKEILNKHPEFSELRVFVNFTTPYTWGEAWIVTQKEVMTEVYTATGVSTIDMKGA